jgi:putative protease
MGEKTEKKMVGEVLHYFTDIEVGIIGLSDKLKVGDEILIEGSTTSFKQKVDSMQIEHENVKEADNGDEIGLKVKERVREGDSVYKIE